MFFVFYLHHYYPVQALYWSCYPNLMFQVNFMTTWSLGLILSCDNVSGGLEPLLYLEQCLKKIRISLTVVVRATLFSQLQHYHLFGES